jgi:tryptophanyl-tRNA synthetase
MTTRILTGITTTGTPHLGNYAGAIRPAILASQTAMPTRSTSWPTTTP